MGMFGKKKHNVNKCNCPHCRGGHLDPLKFESGSEYDVEHDVLEFEVADLEDIVENYIEQILECEDEDEVAETVYDFYDELYKAILSEIYIGDIQGRIEALNMLKNDMLEDDEE